MKETSKTSKGIVFLDLETTGVEVAVDRIVQLAVVKRFNDGTVEEKTVLVNPSIPIPKGASDVHGITDEMVKDCPKFNQIAKSFYGYIEGFDIGGYNILGFDIPLLVEEFLRANVQFSFDNIRFIDVMNIYKKLNPRDLSSCYKNYTGKTLEGAHDALNDTRATADIFDAMMLKEELLIGKTIDEVSDISMLNKGIVDYAGKFMRNEAGVICFAFGKDKGNPVSKNLSFLDWIISKDFTQDTKNWAMKLKRGEAI
jgi:DNA polymerase-3 subunit epsilon